MKDIKFILGFVKRYKYQVAWGAILIILTPLIILPIPMLVKNLIDVDIPKGDINNIVKYSFMILALFFISKLFSFIQSKIFYITNCKMVQDIRSTLVYKYFNSNVLSTLDYDKGDITTIIEEDIKNISIFFIDKIASIARDIISIIISVYMLISISAIMSTCVLIAMAVYLIVTKVFKLRLENIFNNYMKSIAESKNELIDLINNSDFIRVNKYQDYAVDRYDKTAIKKMNLNIKRGKITILGNTLISTISESLPYISILFGGILVTKGHFSIGSIIAFNTYLNNFIGPLGNLSEYNFNYREAIVSLKRMMDIFNLESENISENCDEIESICINNLSLELNNAEILKDINFRINKGEKVLIYGASGCGKTSLINCIIGAVNKTSGNITYLSKDNKPCDFNCSYIKSDAFVFNSYVIENIFLDKEEDNEKLSALLSSLNISEAFLECAANATECSHGQRQKLNLIRALYDERKVLIIDEGLSNIDSKDLNNIIDGLLNIEDLTLIMISHNTEMRSKFKRIINMKSGKILLDELNLQEVF